MGPEAVGIFHFTPANIACYSSVHISPLLLKPMTNDPFSPPLIKLGHPEQVKLKVGLSFLRGVMKEKKDRKLSLVVFLNLEGERVLLKVP